MEISKSSTSGVKKKARVTQACDQCIRARRGCTGELPCKLCFERKKKCSYTKVPKKRGPPVGYIQTKRENAAEENELNIPVEEATEIISASAQTLLIDTLARIPVNLQPTQLSPLEVVSSRPRDITQWNFVTFATILFLNEDQSVSGLFEFYFRWVFPKLPIFSKNWLAKNMAHIPLPLFHAIYACCLCFPLKQPPSHQVANTHYRYASSAVYNNLEQSDGWTVAILIHLAFYALDRITPFAANAHAAAGMSLAEIFGFHLDLSFPFPSMSSSLALNTCRSMWYILYQWDFNSYFLFNVDLKISSMVLIDSLETYVMPNQNDSSNIQENALTFCRYSLPQINFAKSIIYALKDRDFSMESRFLLLTGMDNWFALLPGNLRVRDDDFQWIGRSIGYLNEMHHLLRMKLLLPAFLISLESGNLTDLAVVESLGSARKVTNIARSYLSHRDGLHDKNIMLERCVYISGLLLCACSAVFHLDFSLDIQVHLEAMKIIYMNSDVQNFEYCVVSPALAIQILQTKFL